MSERQKINLKKKKKNIHFMVIFVFPKLLTIIPRARMGSESAAIARKAEG